VSTPSVEIPASLDASLVLVRHGESTYVAEGRFQGRQDPPLSALGEEQARLAAERLARRDEGTPLPIPLGLPLAVFHSPLSRAAHTARLIGDAQPGQIELNALAGLTEIAQGEWEGLPATEVARRWPAELERWRQSPTTDHAPGGEPVLEAAARIRTALAGIIARLAEADDPAPNPSDPVPGYPPSVPVDGATVNPWAVLVAHDGIFRLALLSLMGLPYERFWSFPFNLCAITVITFGRGIATLRAHNLSDHLAPLSEADRAAAEARGDRRGAL
jgi:phosphoserine phosphatase